jgi:hypothetical protein
VSAKSSSHPRIKCGSSCANRECTWAYTLAVELHLLQIAAVTKIALVMQLLVTIVCVVYYFTKGYVYVYIYLTSMHLRIA